MMEDSRGKMKFGLPPRTPTRNIFSSQVTPPSNGKKKGDREKVVNPFFQDGVQHFPDFFETGLITEDHATKSGESRDWSTGGLVHTPPDIPNNPTNISQSEIERQWMFETHNQSNDEKMERYFSSPSTSNRLRTPDRRIKLEVKEGILHGPLFSTNEFDERSEDESIEEKDSLDGAPMSMADLYKMIHEPTNQVRAVEAEDDTESLDKSTQWNDQYTSLSQLSKVTDSLKIKDAQHDTHGSRVESTKRMRYEQESKDQKAPLSPNRRVTFAQSIDDFGESARKISRRHSPMHAQTPGYSPQSDPPTQSLFSPFGLSPVETSPILTFRSRTSNSFMRSPKTQAFGSSILSNKTLKMTDHADIPFSHFGSPGMSPNLDTKIARRTSQAFRETFKIGITNESLRWQYIDSVCASMPGEEFSSKMESPYNRYLTKQRQRLYKDIASSSSRIALDDILPRVDPSQYSPLRASWSSFSDFQTPNAANRDTLRESRRWSSPPDFSPQSHPTDFLSPGKTYDSLQPMFPLESINKSLEHGVSAQDEHRENPHFINTDWTPPRQTTSIFTSVFSPITPHTK